MGAASKPGQPPLGCGKGVWVAVTNSLTQLLQFVKQSPPERKSGCSPQVWHAGGNHCLRGRSLLFEEIYDQALFEKPVWCRPDSAAPVLLLRP